MTNVPYTYKMLIAGETSGGKCENSDFLLLKQYSDFLHCFEIWLSSLKVTQWWLTLCDPMDCSSCGPTVYRALLARILEWIVVRFSRGSSQHRDQTRVFCIADRFFTSWVTREAQFSKPPIFLCLCGSALFHWSIYVSLTNVCLLQFNNNFNI